MEEQLSMVLKTAQHLCANVNINIYKKARNPGTIEKKIANFDGRTDGLTSEPKRV